MATKSSKQFAVSDTSLLHRYKTDVFFRTMCHIIGLQIILTTIIIVVFWYAMQYLANNLTQTMILEITEMLHNGKTLTSDSLVFLLENTTTEQFLTVAVAVTAVVLCFGFIMAYIALTPTKNSFERKKRFVSNIAHEIRTPIAVIRTNTDVALMDPHVPSSLRETLRENLTELEKVTAIMNNLMSLSNLMRGDEMLFGEQSFASIAEHGLESLRQSAQKKDIRLSLTTRTKVPVVGNAAALEQVVFNLVKNAILHTPKGGSVRVIVVDSEDIGYVNLVVEDTGVGIPREELSQIFQPFYRTRQNKARGTGLGLTIVSEIVQIHHGKIYVQSIEGEGTTMTISIPAHNPKGASPLASRTTQTTNEIVLDFS